MEAVSPKTKVRFTETGQFSVDFEMIYTCRVHSKQCAPEILLTLICPFFPSHRKKGAGRGGAVGCWAISKPESIPACTPKPSETKVVQEEPR